MMTVTPISAGQVDYGIIFGINGGGGCMEEIINIVYHNPNIEKIQKFENGDWIDLRAAETVEMKMFDYKLISLGVSMKLPDGYEAHIVPRSSTFKNFGILSILPYIF